MPERVDPARRLRELIDRLAPRLRRRFLELMARVRSDRSLSRIANLIEQGRASDALRIVERAAESYAAEVGRVTFLAGTETAAFLSQAVGIVLDFDQTNQRAVAAMAANRLQLVREFSREQREATKEALEDGVRLGLNPREQARAFRDSIGLTATQQRAVNNYRRLLREGSAEALSRALRDKRFDPSVRAAIAESRTLTRAQVDLMVSRYAERYAKYRSEVIARTEALRSVHQGSEEAYRQAFDTGELDPAQITRQWNTARDERVRGIHRSMHGQKRRAGEPFQDGAGNRLRYPGDPAAPASSSVSCRCAIGTRIRLPEPVETAGARVLVP